MSPDQPLKSALVTAQDMAQLDIGCIAAHGVFFGGKEEVRIER
jgi:hypothetical protein